jgi:ribosomal protein S12 methylthiotransferase accessory factor
MYGSEFQRGLNALSRLYNRLHGPVTSLTLSRPELSDFSMYTSSCNHSLIGSLMPDLMVRPTAADTMSIPGGGKGVGLQQPILSALGEIAERLLAVLHFEAVADELEFSTYELLLRKGHRALGPEDLPLFAPEQCSAPAFPFVPYRSNTPLRWIEARDLLSGDPLFVPAQLVLLYYKRAPGEALIGYPTSGGLAFHADRRLAILHGLYEFIERDAVNVRWFCRLPPPRVDIDLPDFLVNHLKMQCARISTPFIEGPSVYLNTLDLPIPVFTVTAIDTSRGSYAFLGSGGAGSGRTRALEQALFELGQTRAVLKSYNPTDTKNIQSTSCTSEMNEFLDGAVYFGYESNLPRLSWYLSDGGVVPWDDVPGLSFNDVVEEYQAALSWSHAAGLTPIVMDFDSACWPGVFVTRVLVPQLTMACVPAHPYLGHPRYYELPRQLGFADRMLEFQDLNTDPIPFP